MKKAYILSTIGLVASSLVAMEPTEQAPMVTLVSAEGKEFTIAKQAAELSGTIKNMLADLPTKAPVPFPNIKTNTLQAIVTILKSADEQVQKQTANKLKQSDLIQRPDDSSFESANGGFIARNVQPFVNTVLSPQNIDPVKEVAQAAHFLEIPFLINAGAKVYVEKYLEKRPKAEWHNVLGAIKGDFSEDIHMYFKKHFKLAKAGAKKELSIADYIALYGQPEQRPVFGTITLTLKNEGLTSLYGFSQLSITENVKRLNLSQNYILDQQYDPDYPAEPFSTFSNLESLYLDSNQITTVQTNAFLGLNKLESLHLYNNQITTIEPNAFQELNKLKTLHLEDNQITTVQTNAFQGLNNLEELYLDENKITTIQTNAFRGLNNLAWLYLKKNKITTIQSNAFQGLNKLVRLRLENNPLTESAKEIKQKHFPDQEIDINISD